LLAAIFGGIGALCAIGLIVTTYWLLGQTWNDEKARSLPFRFNNVPAAALRGEWPDLPSAQWYRRLFRGLMIGWIGGAVSVIVHELSR
jgi:hypothetical protein